MNPTPCGKETEMMDEAWPEPEDCEPCPVCGNEERHARTGLWTCECPSLDRLKAFGRQPDALAAIRKGGGR